jgi:hypothetical protein
MDESMSLEDAYHKGFITLDKIPDPEIRAKLEKEKEQQQQQPQPQQGEQSEKQVTNKQMNALRRGHNTQKKKRKEDKIERKQQTEYIEERIDNILKILDENNGSLEEKALLQRFIYLYKRRTRTRT